MIRVTFNNGYCECLYFRYDKETDSYRARSNYDDTNEWICRQEPIKIEKQVKDLTLEECEKLGLEPNTKFLNGKFFGIDSVTSEDFGCFQRDDYVDITAIFVITF